MKKKALVLAICMAYATPAMSLAKAKSTDISGLNLGEIQSDSYLGEPFKGIIPILLTSKNKASKLSVRLAPLSVFTKLGADRSTELNKLHFKIANVNNKPVILVSSKNAIHLPFLNFILEIESTQGSIYQDYTIMLDPRGYNSVNNQTVSNKTKQLGQKRQIVSSKKNPLQYKIQSGDSLSKISRKFKSSGISLNKMMEGIHLKNPTAFISNDINRIKRGNVLNIPTLKELSNLDSITHKIATTEKNDKLEVEELVSDSASTTNNTYTVKSGDTLSKITKAYMQEGISFTKMMKAIHLANPHAFSKNRINILKANAVLTIPSSAGAEIKEIVEKNTAPISSEKEVKHQETIVDSQNITMQGDTKNSVDNSAKAKVTLIQEIKAANDKAVENLEKRVRELRGELSTVSTNYSVLKAELKTRNGLLMEQKLRIKKLKNTVSDIEEDTRTAKDNEKRTNKANTSEITSLTSDEAKTDLENNTGAAGNINRSKTTERPESIEQVISQFINAMTTEENDLLSVKNLSYATVILFLGLLLIRRKKEQHSYIPIPINIPRNSSTDIIPLNIQEDEEDLNLDNPNLNKLKADNTDKHQSKLDFSEEKIHECELLVGELFDDLEGIQPVNSEHKVTSKSDYDQEIEALINGKEYDVDNFFQEDTLATTNKNKTKEAVLDPQTSNSPDTDKIESEIDLFKSFSSFDTSSFETKMDQLVNLVKEDDQVVEFDPDKKEAPVIN